MVVLLSMSGRLDSVLQRRLHGRARPEGAEHDQRVNGREGQLRIYVIVDARQAVHPYLQRLTSITHQLQVTAGVVLQPEHQRLARYRLPDILGVRRQLVANGSSDEVCAVGVETFLYQQIYLPQIHKSQIDRDLLRLTHADLIRRTSVQHLLTIHMDGTRGTASSSRWKDIFSRIGRATVFGWREARVRGRAHTVL